jgi:hypothetical protein
MPPPVVLRATLPSQNGRISELSIPLYSPSLEPLWEEHQDGGKVDIAIYSLPYALEKDFMFFDIHSATKDEKIAEEVAKDVFILGYPFSRDELKASFGDEAPYFLPVWKRGSIASEPGARLDHRVLLIDSMSRPGMSGAPIVITEDARVLRAQNGADSELLRRLKAGDHTALKELDVDALSDEMVKRFRFLGVYSGVLGQARLAEVALGICWHVDVLRELVENSHQGKMPFHAPIANPHLDAFLAQFATPELTIKDPDGNVVKRTQLRK